VSEFHRGGRARAHARLGQARALLALDRAADALALLDPLIRERPELDDVLDLRARALSQLGRTDEAEAQRAEYMRAIVQRSERRVRSR
jgi:predicted Zn-dependent protease